MKRRDAIKALAICLTTPTAIPKLVNASTQVTLSIYTETSVVTGEMVEGLQGCINFLITKHTEHIRKLLTSETFIYDGKEGIPLDD